MNMKNMSLYVYFHDNPPPYYTVYSHINAFKSVVLLVCCLEHFR